MKKYLIINGPNLNLLGSRDPEIYGKESLQDIEKWLNIEINNKDINIYWYQTNHEGKIIDRIQRASNEKINGIILNAGALTHYSYAIRDAISAFKLPVVEVHLSDINKREKFRSISVIKDVCIKQISGIGKNSYLEGFKILESL